MPQLGETVTEGTITRWFKNVGDHIDADEPLFEVSTDKVDSEVPAPSAGTVSEILVPEGETVPVGARLAVISDGAAAPAPAAAAPAPAPEPAAETPPVPAAGGDEMDPPLTSPIVRRLVAERGLDARSIRGTGPGGRCRGTRA